MNAEIKLGKITFIISRTKSQVKLHGYRLNNEFVGFGRPKIVNPDNRSFFDEIRMLMKLAGYEISNSELEKRYIEADQYVKKEAEKWKRIKRAWGIP